MAEETYQEVVDKIKDEEEKKDEILEQPPELKKCETIVEEKEEN